MAVQRSSTRGGTTADDLVRAGGQKRTREELKLFIDRIAGTLGLVLALITLAGVAGAAVVAMVVAPGFVDEPEKFALLVPMLRITFPTSC